MSTTTYVFVEKSESYQHFSNEKSTLSVAMLRLSKNLTIVLIQLYLRKSEN